MFLLSLQLFASEHPAVPNAHLPLPPSYNSLLRTGVSDARLNECIAELTRVRSELIQERATQDQMTSDMRRQLHQWSECFGQWQQAYQVVVNERDNASRERHRLSSENRVLNERINELRAARARSNALTAALTTPPEVLTAQELRARIKELEESQSREQAELRQKRQEISALREIGEKQEESLSNYERGRQQSEDELFSLRKEKKEFEKRLCDLQVLLDRRTEEHNAIIAEHDQQNRELRKELEKKPELRQESDDLMQQILAELSARGSKQKDLEDQLHESRMQMEAWAVQSKQHEDEKRQSQVELKRRDDVILCLQGEKESLTQARDIWAQEKDSLQKQLNELKAQNRKLSKQRDDLTAQREAHEADEEELQKALTKIGALQKDLAAAKRDLQNQRKALEEKNQTDRVASEVGTQQEAKAKKLKEQLKAKDAELNRLRKELRGFQRNKTQPAVGIASFENLTDNNAVPQIATAAASSAVATQKASGKKSGTKGNQRQNEEDDGEVFRALAIEQENRERAAQEQKQRAAARKKQEEEEAIKSQKLLEAIVGQFFKNAVNKGAAAAASSGAGVAGAPAPPAAVSSECMVFGQGKVIDETNVSNIAGKEVHLHEGVKVEASLKDAKCVVIEKNMVINETVAGYLAGAEVCLGKGSSVKASLKGTKYVGIGKGMIITEEVAGYLAGANAHLYQRSIVQAV